jgi:hypothetical protein
MARPFLYESIYLCQTDIRQHNPFAGVDTLALFAGDDDDLLFWSVNPTAEILVQGLNPRFGDALSGDMGSVGTKGHIHPSFLAFFFCRAGLIDSAFRVASHAEHQGHNVLQRDLLRAILAFEVELGGLGTSQITPEMVALAIIILRRDGLLREEGDPVLAVKTPLDHQISAADIVHDPVMFTSLPGLSLGHFFLHYQYTREAA